MNYKTNKTVRISDKDSCGNIKFSALMSMMQEAADEQSALVGINNEAMLNKGLAWVLTRMAVKVERNVKAFESLTITTCALQSRSIEFPREYALTDSDGNEVAYGIGMWSVIDMATRRLTRASEIDGYANMLDEHEQKYAFKKERMSLNDEFVNVGAHIVLNTEIDMLGHLNNVYYADMVQNALTPDEFAVGYSELNISYLHEARLGDKIELYKHTTDGAIEIIGMINEEKCFSVSLR